MTEARKVYAAYTDALSQLSNNFQRESIWRTFTSEQERDQAITNADISYRRALLGGLTYFFDSDKSGEGLPEDLKGDIFLSVLYPSGVRWGDASSWQGFEEKYDEERERMIVVPRGTTAVGSEAGSRACAGSTGRTVRFNRDRQIMAAPSNTDGYT